MPNFINQSINIYLLIRISIFRIICNLQSQRLSRLSLQPDQQNLNQNQLMSIHQPNTLLNSNNSSRQIKQFLYLYCQPCLKRGLMNKPAFVNLNEFENNRYICESCSFGQTYIIALGKEFFSSKQKEVKLEKRLKTITETNEKQTDLENIQPQPQPINNELMTEKPSVNHLNDQINHLNDQINHLNDQINHTQTNLQNNQDTEQHLQQISQLPQFVKNIQINSNPESKYSIADIDMYTENITLQYKQAMNVIQKYQDMIKSHINKWKNKLKAQFQGVIGTFGNATVGLFLNELRSLQEMEKSIKVLEQRMKQEGQSQIKGESQRSNQNKNQQQQKLITNLEGENLQSKADIKEQQDTKRSLRQLYQQSLNVYKIQQQKITLYVETLKMSGIRNLSNLKSLYNCCKGFSDAVRILISLEHKETNRRFDFISQKFKVCSIETLYDAQMINGGYLDNRLQKPPGFDIISQQTEKKSFKKVMQQDFNQRKKVEAQILKQLPSSRLKKQQEDTFLSSQQKATQKPINQIQQHQQRQNKQQQQQQKHLQHNHHHQEISLISSQSQREQSFIEFNQRYDENNNNLQKQKSIKQEIFKKNIQLQKQDNFQREKMAKMRYKKPFSSGLLNSNFIDQQNIINENLRLEKQKQHVLMNNKGNQNGNEIDLENYTTETQKTNETSQLSYQNPNSPFPALRQFYQYQKGQNEFVSKLQLTQQNFETFPPPNIYMPSVESLTIKYCPPATNPWELLKTLKSCFRKLTQLIIQQPKIATKQMIIMIAEYFPKLKSLVIRCKNEFDWQLGKLFEKKMGQLVRFEVNDGEKS